MLPHSSCLILHRNQFLQTNKIDVYRFTPVKIEVSGFSEFVILGETSDHLLSLCVPQTHLVESLEHCNVTITLFCKSI